MAGARYPDGIPVYPESRLAEAVARVAAARLD